jgi:hypothetical protein
MDAVNGRRVLPKEKTMRRLLSTGLLAAALAATGCSHAMHITNLHEYQLMPTAPLQPPRNAGVTSTNLSDPMTRGYVDAIVENLRRDGSFDRVVYPCDDPARPDLDVLLDVSVLPQYSGKGSNFFVNWPGFLIFAPAMMGYGYEAALDTSVNIRTRGGPSQTLAIPMRYTFRQAEIDRTWTEIGWLEVGIIPLIGGMAVTSYDTDLTPEFVVKVGPSYGAFVAQRIRESLGAAHASLAPVPVPVTEDSSSE